MSITYSECVFVALGFLHAIRMLHIFPHYLMNGTILEKPLFENIVCFAFRKTVIEHKMSFYFLYNFCLQHFSFYRWAKSRYTVIIFFTGIVNDGRELKYRTKKVDFEAVLEN